MSRLLAVLLLISSTAPASSHDWPQFRGPKRDAVSTETGLLKEWPKGGPPILWKQKGLGGGYSTPSVAGGRIYGMSFQGEDEVVWARDEATGDSRWTTRIAAKSRLDRGEGPRSTPTLDDGRVYAVGVQGDLACLDASTGKLIWSKNYKRDFRGRMMSGWGYSESVLVDGDKVIGTPGGDNAALAAFDKKTGRVIWTARVPDAGGSGYASVMPAEVGGIRMYITWLQSKLVGVSAKDGELLWENARPANRVANIPSVIVKGDLVFASTGYQAGTTLLKLHAAGSKLTAEEVYDLPGTQVQNHHGGMVLVGDHVYLGHGHNAGRPMCVELATGKVVWKADRPVASGSAGVVYADGNIVFRHQEGKVALVEATPAGYMLHGSFDQPDRSKANAWSHPVIANGKLYLRDQDVLICYDIRKTS
ncbi:MAG TPA: PQQ-binding-like beta-propeller repeat protein [Gemmataceae bacterium]|jgi:outer membrane protein assembly factor BamB|nr:PQQ-binding-like beta-propeller repeat protein [Gemmataceae bacterium]